jgi:hypothetical protein
MIIDSGRARALSAFHRLMPIADGVTSRSEPSRYIDATTKHIGLALLIIRINAMSATRLAGPIVASNHNTDHQIPIAV